MEAFAKHWNKEIRPYIHNPKDREIAEYWWRAALEAVEKLRETCPKNAGFEDYVADFIQEELNNG